MPDPAPGRIALSGDITLRSADETCASLRTALAAHGSLQIDCAAVTHADLSLVQLLVATRRAARRDGGDARLAAPAHGALLDTLSAAGFRACGNETDGFWFEGNAA